MAYRPLQWNELSGDQTELIHIATNIAAQEGEGQEMVGYFFDAIIRAEHNTGLRLTEHPIQSGANVVDHAFQLPAILTLEIGMSDAMDAMIQGQFTGGETKSVSAYQKLIELQAGRYPLQVTTRLNTYQNMVIEMIQAPDDHKTIYGLRCTVVLRQLITAEVGTTVISADPDSTDSTNKGAVLSAEPTEQQGSVLSHLKGLN